METEDKREIIKALLPVLQMTRQLNDLTDLQYEAYENGLEFVVAFFGRSKKYVNISGDSGIAMIYEIAYRLGA